MNEETINHGKTTVGLKSVLIVISSGWFFLLSSVGGLWQSQVLTPTEATHPLQALLGPLSSRSSCSTTSFLAFLSLNPEERGFEACYEASWNMTWPVPCHRNYTEASIWAYSPDVLCRVSLKDKPAQLHKQHWDTKRMHSESNLVLALALPMTPGDFWSKKIIEH